MYKLLPALLVAFFVICGSVTDTSSGSIVGSVITEDGKYEDTVTVLLYSGNVNLAKKKASNPDPLKSQITFDGDYKFDSLDAGSYWIQVMKNDIELGRVEIEELVKGEERVVNIHVEIIINQTFHITNIVNTVNVTVENYYFIEGEGTIDDMGEGKFVASFAGMDTVRMEMELTIEEQTDTVTISFTRQEDGTYVSLPLETELPVTVTNGTTVINKGIGGDTASVSVTGTVKEEAR